LVGCSPAEPTAVSPGSRDVSQRRAARKGKRPATKAVKVSRLRGPDEVERRIARFWSRHWGPLHNLNLIERLWKFLRKEALQKWHPTFEAMQEAIAQVLDNLPDYEEDLQTLMTERVHLTPEISTIVVGNVVR
jgi:hypothetical protein